MHTSCQDCIFAIWDDNIQKGCKYNRLDKFEKELINKQYYKLNGICNICRNKEWQDRIGDNYLEVLDREIAIKTDFIFINTESNVDAVKINTLKTLKDLEQNNNKPTSVTFTSIADINISEYARLIKDNCKFKFNVVNPILKKDLLSIIDMCVNYSKANYYIVYHLTKDNKLTDINDKLNIALNDKVMKFLMINDTDFHGTVIQRYLHKLLGGNTDKSIIEKINELNKLQETNMVLSWNDLE